MYNRWLTSQDELYHHGIKGQKWGVRRKKTKSRGKLKTKKLGLNLQKMFNATLSSIKDSQLSSGMAHFISEQNRLFNEQAIQFHQQMALQSMQTTQFHTDNFHNQMMYSNNFW